MKKLLTLLALTVSFNSLAQQTRITGSSRWEFGLSGFAAVDSGFYIYNSNNATGVADTSYGVNPQTLQISGRSYTVKSGKNYYRIGQSWSSSTNQWVNTSKNEYLYNSAGNLISTIQYTWNGAAFIPSFKDSTNYTSAGLYTSKYNFSYSVPLNKWDLVYRSVTFYNSVNMVDSIKDAWLINAQWRDTAKMVYSYVSPSYGVSFHLAKNGGNWDTSLRDFKRFDSQKRVTLDSTQAWNMPGQWISFFSHSYRFDANGNRILDSSQTGTSISNYAHENFSKTTYDYNVNNQPTRELKYYWDKATSTWIFKPAGSSSASYDYRFYYATYNNVLDLATHLSANVYPNPASGFISVDLPESGEFSMVLSSVDGDVQHTSNFSGKSHTIDVRHIPPAVYVLTVKGKEGRYSQLVTIR